MTTQKFYLPLSAHCRKIQRVDTPSKFSWSEKSGQGFHAERRQKIIASHPEVLKLFGYDHNSAIFCSVTVLIQFLMAYFVRNLSWPVVIILSYVVSGTLNHSLVLAMHEATHGLFFASRWLNRLFGVIATLPTGIASSSSFKTYHSEHHASMGVATIDMDLPTELEAKLFRSSFGRFLFVVLQPLFYSLRPLFLSPRPATMAAIANWIFQILVNTLIWNMWGPKSFFYLFVGTLFGLSLHPISGHFIAEHFEFVSGQETYSYYGPLNWLTYNVGYHNEHHDFPRIPCSRLPMLKSIAPEFYDTLPSYSSWSKVLFDFIVNENVNLYARIKREEEKPVEVPVIKKIN